MYSVHREMVLSLPPVHIQPCNQPHIVIVEPHPVLAYVRRSDDEDLVVSRLVTPRDLKPTTSRSRNF